MTSSSYGMKKFVFCLKQEQKSSADHSHTFTEPLHSH